jgi:hypothetical protein
VADDLEPDDTGRPARRRYWASDLSIRHEQSHIDDDLEAAAAALVTATAWLDGRQADSEEEVLDLLARLQHDVKAAIERHHLAGGERRARAADQDLYARRAATIRARAGAEGWAGATCPAAGTTTTKRGTT